MSKNKTAEAILAETYKEHGWKFQPNVINPSGCPHESLAIKAAYAYASQQTEALREENERLNKELDIVHLCLTELYSHQDNTVGDTVKKCVDDLERLI